MTQHGIHDGYDRLPARPHNILGIPYLNVLLGTSLLAI